MWLLRRTALEKRKIEYLTQEHFIPSSETKLFHGFFTRKGGSSKGLYKGLNCGLGSGDDSQDITGNRETVAKNAGVAPQNLLGAYQVHGAKVIRVEKTWTPENRPHADALVSDRPEIALSILTADCAPVLFTGKKENGDPVIGAAHAGWKGALTGVMEETLSAMMDLGAQEKSLRACVGPCIAQPSYEVEDIFKKAFLEEDKASECFFTSGEKVGYTHFDLSAYCAWRLKRFGIMYVSSINKDTYTHENEFYSYRRATHRNEPHYGRQISVISIL